VAKKIAADREDVVFYIKLFPLPIHPKAHDKARTIICKGKSLELLEDAFAGKELPEPDCEAKEVDANIALAKELGFGGTPTIIFPDGRVHAGYVEEGRFLQLLAETE
jgi:thiol:disulfide interchange protein DsbC